jgi:hypothetical protein
MPNARPRPNELRALIGSMAQAAGEAEKGKDVAATVGRLAADRLHVVQRLRGMSASASRHVASGQDRRKGQARPGAWPPGRDHTEAGRQAPGTGLRGRRLPAGVPLAAKLHAPGSCKEWKEWVERVGLSALQGTYPGLADGGIFWPSRDDLPDLTDTVLPRLVSQLAAVRTRPGDHGPLPLPSGSVAGPAAQRPDQPIREIRKHAFTAQDHGHGSRG